MDKEQILQYIKSTETAAIEPDAAAEIYAFALSVLQPNIPETNMRQLLLVGAAMYRNSTIVNSQNADLQMPRQSTVPFPNEASEYIQ